MSDPDVQPEDALQVAQRALAKVGELEDDLDQLRSDHEETAEELTRVSLRLSEIDEERDYEALSRDEKVGQVREHLFKKATSGAGRATLDYSDVRWEVFDGEPGAAHCYDLMELAADHRGFEVREPDGGNRQLAVDAEAAKRGVAFFAKKNRSDAEVARR